MAPYILCEQDTRCVSSNRIMSMFLVCMLFLGSVDAFLPNRLYDGDIGHGTLTHEDITRIGIVKAVASFFDDNPRNGSTPLRPGHFARTPELTARKLFLMYYGGMKSLFVKLLFKRKFNYGYI